MTKHTHTRISQALLESNSIGVVLNEARNSPKLSSLCSFTRHLGAVIAPAHPQYLKKFQFFWAVTIDLTNYNQRKEMEI